MSEYLTHFNHFRFEKDADEVVVTSQRDDSFEERYSIPSDVNVYEGEELFDTYYTKVYSDYQEHQS
jgi:hypothetical protein